MGPRGNFRHALAPRPLLISNHPVGLRHPHLAGRYRPGVSAFSSRRCWRRRNKEEFLIRGWERFLLCCSGTSGLARGETLAARCLRGPQPIIHHPAALGIPHPAGRCRPGGSAFSSKDCTSCRNIETFLIRRWELFLPGCGGTSVLARWQLSPRASSMGPIQSAITQWGWGVHTLWTGIDPGVLRFPPRVALIVKIPKNV